jgi:protein-tyrosine phosphatase
MTLDCLTELPFGFTGRIFRSPMPFGPYDPQGEVFQRYQEQGVVTVLVLAQENELLSKSGRDLYAFYVAHGLEVLHFPIPDFNVPSAELIQAAIDACLQRAKMGRHIAVHCNAGIGRTGLFMACLAKRCLNYSAEEAIAWVRRYIPHAVETADQEQFVLEF